MNPGSRTTVIVVSYNHASEIDACLGALGSSTPRPRTIVVDNASADGTADVVTSNHPWVELVALDANVGYAGAHNAVLGRIDSAVVTLVNPDCVVDPDTIRTLERVLLDDPSLGAVSALLTDLDGTPQAFTRRDLDLGIVVGDLTWSGRHLDQRLNDGAVGRRRRYEAELAALPPPTVADPAPVVDVDCPAAACVALRRSILPDQLFRPDLPLMFNDAALYRYLRARGFRVVVTSAARAGHGYGTSIRKLPRGRYRAEFVRSALAYTRHEWPRRRRAGVLGALLADALIQAAAGAVRRDRSLLTEARGTLGGLGVPGGTAPWLSPPETAAAVARRSAGSLRRLPGDVARGWHQRWWQLRFRAAARLAAWRGGLRLRLDVHPTAVVEPGIRFDLRGPAVRIAIDERVHVRRGTIFRVWGGEVHLGPASEVRHDACLSVKGTFEMGPRGMLGRGSSVHVDGAMRWGAGVTVAELSTIIDSDHTHGNGDIGTLLNPTEAEDVTLEDGCFVGARAQIGPGVTVGRGAVVGANAVVVGDVEPHTIVVGAPARAVARVEDPPQ